MINCKQYNFSEHNYTWSSDFRCHGCLEDNPPLVHICVVTNWKESNRPVPQFNNVIQWWPIRSHSSGSKQQAGLLLRENHCRTATSDLVTHFNELVCHILKTIWGRQCYTSTRLFWFCDARFISEMTGLLTWLTPSAIYELARSSITALWGHFLKVKEDRINI